MKESHGKILSDMAEYIRAAAWQIEELKTLDERADMVRQISDTLHTCDRQIREEMIRQQDSGVAIEMSLETARFLITAVGAVSAVLAGTTLNIVDWYNDDEQRYKGRKAMSYVLAQLFDADNSLQRLCNYYEDEDIPF